ncbi:MAG: hypothetical protein MHMPM18_002713 [Marteilia pararefringens]
MFRLAPLLNKILRQTNTKAATLAIPQLASVSLRPNAATSIGIWWASLSGMTYLTLCVGGLTR